MTLTHDVALTDFEFWSGAKDTADALTRSQLDALESIIEDAYPEGMTDTELNDLFWFEEDWIAEMLGFDDFEDLQHENNGDVLLYRVFAGRVFLAEFEDEDEAEDYIDEHDEEVEFGGTWFDLTIEEEWR